MDFQHIVEAINTIKALRHPKTGCPWDLKQTHKSLIKYLIEESYEYIHAIEQGDIDKMEEELGDVLLQVLLHAQIAEDNKHFDLGSVAKKLSEKMIHRHPHVFKDPSLASTPEEVTKNWQKLKNKPKAEFSITEEDIYLPSLQASYKIGEKSKTINFDWEKVEDVLAKVEEELEEVKVEMKASDYTKTRDEIGDLLFSVAQLARHLDIDPEEALKEANQKFVRRINKVETIVRKTGKEMKDLSVDELETVWQENKHKV